MYENDVKLSNLWITLVLHPLSKEQEDTIKHKFYELFINEKLLVYIFDKEFPKESWKEDVNKIKIIRNRIIDYFTFKSGAKDFSKFLKKMLLSIDFEKGYNKYVFEHAVVDIISVISSNYKEKQYKYKFENFVSLLSFLSLKYPSLIGTIKKNMKRFKPRHYYYLMKRLHDATIYELKKNRFYENDALPILKFWINFYISQDKYYEALKDATYLSSNDFDFFKDSIMIKVKEGNKKAISFLKRIKVEIQLCSPNDREFELLNLLSNLKEDSADYSDLPLFNKKWIRTNTLNKRKVRDKRKI